MNLQSRIEPLVTAAIDKWGQQVQMVKACEECAELVVQLCKIINRSPSSIDAVIDEVADVLIVAHSMRQVFGPIAVDARIEYKLDRLEKALAKDYAR